MTDAPERVWLQDVGEWSGDAYMKGDLTWCDIAIDKNDTEYIRADLYQSALDRAVKAEAECERLRAALDIAEAQAVEMATDADGILWSDKAAELQGHVRGSEHIIEVWRSRCQKAEAECERLRAALLLIAEERGVCGACGMIATGPAPGMVGCDRNGGYNCNWQFQEPEKIARAALEGK